MYKLLVIGVDGRSLTAGQRELLAGCAAVIGTQRFRKLAAHLDIPYHAITPLNTALQTMHSTLKTGNIGVLASGDPLFYGLGRRLLTEFSPAQVQFFPALSSLQQACALFRLPWDDAAITSLHGRNHPHIPGLLLANRKNLVFTDRANSPDTIAAQLLDYLHSIGDTELPETIRMLVAEDIGLATEKLFQGNLTETIRRQFSPLNVLCLLVPQQGDSGWCRFGLTEEVISHSRGLITKNEVRAATLHWLQLPDAGVLWDIGAGSGSLSIEAARLCPRLTIYAVEHNEEEFANIKKNIVKFRCYNIIPILGRAPGALATLPHPDRVFVGGSGGALAEIVERIAGVLANKGRLVINGVIARTIAAAPQLMAQHGFRVETSTLSVTRTGPDGAAQVFNPITIMTGTL